MHTSRIGRKLTQPSRGSTITDTPTPTQSRRQFLIQAGQMATAAFLSGCAISPPTDQVNELTEKLVFPELVIPEEADAVFGPPLPASINPALGNGAVSLDAKIGQMILAGFDGYELTAHSPIIQDVAEHRVGSVALFGRNIANANQLKQLTASLQAVAAIPLLISADQEGGQVSRVGTHFGLPANYSAAQLGLLNDLTATQTFAEQTAKKLRELGINMNLAPVVDLNTNPSNPVIGAQGRSFSSDPQIVTQQALAFIQAHHQEGIFCTLKHFPGHGSSTADSHFGFVDVTETWSSDELAPFASIIQSGRCDAVMTAHIFNANLDSEHPATLSNRVITGILRQRLGYDGVIMTDDIQMGAIRNYYPFDRAIELSLNAGVDIFSISRYSPALVDRVFATVHTLLDTGRITEERIDSSFRRIVALKSRLDVAAPSQLTNQTNGSEPDISALGNAPTAEPSPPIEPTPSNEPEYLEKLDEFLH